MRTHSVHGISLRALLVLVVLTAHATIAHASSVVAIPAIVDLKGEARDILKGSVVLENKSSRYVELYPFINNISIEDGKQAFLDPASADSASSFANWIELSRSSIMLKSGEKKTVDFRVNVNLRAPPGIYHAVIAFSNGSTREEAEGRISEALQVPVNLEVLEDIRERLQLKKFVSDKVFFSGFPVTFSIDLENVGNRAVTPTGEIRIYDRGGEEVVKVPIGLGTADPIQPGGVAAATGTWKGGEVNQLLASAGVTLSGWGKYKALLEVEYGSSQRGTLNDTVFFWVISWPVVLVCFLIIAGLVVGGTVWLHSRESRKNGSL